MDKLPIRERKKMQTRQRIIDAGIDLVRHEDYASVTIAAICDQADIAQRTFFSYFPSKEAVFFYDKKLWLDEISNKLSTRPEGQTTFKALRELLVSTIDNFLSDNKQEFMKLHQNIECDNTQFKMYGDYMGQQCEDILRLSIAKDLGESPDNLGPTLAAASANSTLRAIIAQITNTKNEDRSKKEVLQILDKTLSFLEAGIAALDKPKIKL
jgi:AcrR family transcriptional regulator